MKTEKNEMTLSDKIYRKSVLIFLLILTAAFSFFYVGNVVTSTDHQAARIESIDDKIQTATELTGAATASSALVSALPDDTCTPIAEKLTDLASCFLIVLCALNLEKYLLTITGLVAFKYLIPAACLIGILTVLFSKAKTFRRFALELGLIALMIYMVIPASLKVSDMIYDTYAESIDETLDTSEEISENASDDDSSISSFISSLTDKASEIKEEVSDTIGNYIKALAVMIVITCLIPILVFAFFIVMIKAFFQANIPLAGNMTGGKNQPAV